MSLPSATIWETLPPLAREDAFMAALWLLVTALLVTAGAQFAGKLFPAMTLLEGVLHTIVICWACVAAAALALGSVGQLGGRALLAAVGLLAAILVWLARGRAGSPGDTAGETVALPGPSFLSASARREGWWMIAWALPLSLALGQAVTKGLLAFPSDWDSLMYHLPLVDHWLHAASLYAPNSRHWSTPGNNELLALWLVAPFSGDFLAGVANVPAIVLLALGALELGRAVGLSRPLANLAALAAVCTRAVWTQLVDAENDVAVAALFVAALAYAARHAREGRRTDRWMAAVSLGLLAGVKYYALGYAAVGAAFLIGCGAWAGGRRGAFQATAAALIGLLLWGGYWYLRNVIVSGSPLYPMQFTGVTNVTPEMRANMWRSTLLLNGRPEVAPLLRKAVLSEGGPCQLYALQAAPFVLAWLALSGWWLRRHGQGADAALRWLMAAAAAGAGVVWGITPYAVEDLPGTLNHLRWAHTPFRYGLCFLTLAVLALALVLQDLTSAVRAALAERERVALVVGWFPALLVAGMLAWQLGPFKGQRLAQAIDPVLLGTNLVLVAGALYQFVEFWPRSRGVVALALACAILAGGTAGAAHVSEAWHRSFAPYYDRLFHTEMFSSLDSRDPSGVRLCILHYRVYPFFGSRRQFALCQPVPRLTITSYPAFLEYLRRNEVTMIVTQPDQAPSVANRYWEMHRWALDHPEVFTPSYKGESMWLFEVKGEPSKSAGADGFPAASGGAKGRRRANNASTSP